MSELQSCPKIVLNPETGSVLEVNQLASDYYGLPAEHLKEQAFHDIGQIDLLTQLPNRQLFLHRLTQAVIESHQTSQSLALIFIDLDRFKPINDSLGHDAGDQVLMAVAKRLKICIRKEDTLARLGGDEFVVLLKDIQKVADIEKVAEKILSLLVLAFPIKNATVEIGGSLGIARFPQDATQANDLLHKADLAMYRAKNNGRNQWAFFQAEMDQEAQQRHRVEKAGRQALAQEEFALTFDPVYNTQSYQDKSLYALETQLAWHPNRPYSNIQIEDLIQLIETHYLGIAINQWHIHHAFELLETYAQEIESLQFIVPVTQIHFRQNNFIDWLDETVSQYSIDPSRMILSLTPASLNTDYFDMAQRIIQITNLGVQVMVNGFGYQGSSLFQMASLDLSAIKLMNFGLASSLGKIERKSEKLASAIIAFAKALTPNVIGSGIENVHQKSFMESHGCTLLQGAYLAETVQEEELDGFLTHLQQNLYALEGDELEQLFEGDTGEGEEIG